MDKCKGGKKWKKKISELEILEAEPGRADFSALYRHTVTFNRFHPKSTLVHKICSRFGVTEYFFTEKGREFISKGKVFRIKDLPKIPNDAKNNLDLINYICDKDSNESVKVKFTPHEDLRLV